MNNSRWFDAIEAAVGLIFRVLLLHDAPPSVECCWIHSGGGSYFPVTLEFPFLSWMKWLLSPWALCCAVNNETIYSPLLLSPLLLDLHVISFLPVMSFSTTFRCLLLTYVHSSRRQFFVLDASRRIASHNIASHHFAPYIQLCFIISAAVMNGVMNHHDVKSDKQNFVYNINMNRDMALR